MLRSEPENDTYTFDTFVSDAAMRDVVAACIAVGAQRAEAPNPLFLFGGTGCGKTHLLRAMARAMRQSGMGRQVLRLPTDSFVRQLIEAIRDDALSAFRRELEALDALLLDDLHLLPRLPGTLAAICHELRNLLGHGVQVVAAAVTPDELRWLQERLPIHSLIVEIPYPGRAARFEIAQRAASSSPAKFSKKRLRAIAAAHPGSTPELRGAVTRIAARRAARECSRAASRIPNRDAPL
jgi:chromosomal replication initiator protein